MALDAQQRAFMRIWLCRSIKRLREQPATEARRQFIATLEKSLERYEEPLPAPLLKIIQGGQAA